jgi:hypothetical protein
VACEPSELSNQQFYLINMHSVNINSRSDRGQKSYKDVGAFAKAPRTQNAKNGGQTKNLSQHEPCSKVGAKFQFSLFIYNSFI